MRIISPFHPKSWFTEIGRAKILRDLKPRLPDVSGKLFLTLTIDPKNFESAEQAFEVSRDRIRRMMFDLRKGVRFGEKCYRIDAPYMVKVEFHRSGFAHFHIIYMTKRFLPGALLNEVWGLGRTNVQRIQNQEFHYLLKYVTKFCDLPDWVKQRERIRIIQTSKGFYKDEDKSFDTPLPINRVDCEDARNHETIGERLDRWSNSALVTEISDSGRVTGRWVVILSEPFRKILKEWIRKIALDGDYLGDDKVVLHGRSVFTRYIIQEPRHRVDCGLSRPRSDFSMNAVRGEPDYFSN